MPFPQNPLINGAYPDYSRVTITLDDMDFFEGITSISYSDSCEPGKARGMQQQILGDTPGEYDCEGSMEMHLQHAQTFMDRLAEGAYNTKFGIVVSYETNEGGSGSRYITDSLVGCRVKKYDMSHKSGSDPLSVKLDLFVTYILWNGFPRIANMRR